jgi:hypothetical protein
MEPHLIRVLALVKPYLRGQDVEAVRRGGLRYLEDDKGWTAYKQMSVTSRRTFGPGMTDLVKRIERKAGLHIDGKAGASVDRILRVSGGYDGTCYGLLKAYADAQVTWCYPHPIGATSSICQKLHETAGIDNNMAYDFCAPGGTKVLAVVNAEVVKISGHPPTYVPDPSLGIFGWNLHYVTPTGYRWFSTHYGDLTVRVGQPLRVGQIVGHVGRWPGDPGRSHTHLGVTSPHGRADAAAWIERVAYAPRVAA